MFHRKLNQYIPLFAIATIVQTSIFPAISYAQFDPPPGNPGAPIITYGTGSRANGKCAKDIESQPQSVAASNLPIDQQFTLVFPQKYFGMTILPNPTFFAYVPKTSAIAIEFSLETKNDNNGFDRKTVNLTNTPSIVSVQFDKSLEIGRDYNLIAAVICEDEAKPDDSYSQGIVRRIQLDPTLKTQLDKASPIEKVSLYVKAGIWHEALAIVAQSMRSDPNNKDLKSQWQYLLKFSNLETLANTPIKN